MLAHAAKLRWSAAPVARASGADRSCRSALTAVSSAACAPPDQKVQALANFDWSCPRASTRCHRTALTAGLPPRGPQPGSWLAANGLGRDHDARKSVMCRTGRPLRPVSAPRQSCSQTCTAKRRKVAYASCAPMQLSLLASMKSVSVLDDKSADCSTRSSTSASSRSR